MGERWGGKTELTLFKGLCISWGARNFQGATHHFIREGGGGGGEGGGASVNFQRVAHFPSGGLYISGAAYFIWGVSGGCKFFQGVAHILGW